MIQQLGRTAPQLALRSPAVDTAGGTGQLRGGPDGVPARTQAADVGRAGGPQPPFPPDAKRRRNPAKPTLFGWVVCCLPHFLAIPSRDSFRKKGVLVSRGLRHRLSHVDSKLLGRDGHGGAQAGVFLLPVLSPSGLICVLQETPPYSAPQTARTESSGSACSFHTPALCR